MTRKKNANMDLFDISIAYLKSNFIFDLLATLPQVASGLSPKFMPLKLIRIYNLGLLHYPAKVCVNLYLR